MRDEKRDKHDRKMITKTSERGDEEVDGKGRDDFRR